MWVSFSQSGLLYLAWNRAEVYTEAPVGCWVDTILSMNGLPEPLCNIYHLSVDRQATTAVTYCYVVIKNSNNTINGRLFFVYWL